MNSKALSIVQTLHAAGHQAVYAGGCVRDFLLGTVPNDIDIATSALPDQVESLFNKTVAVGKSFGVIVVIIDDEEFEVATFRSDGDSSDGRHPDSVSFSSIEDDAKRRDLTINGMYLNPLDNSIIDFVGGQNDLRIKVVRFIGDPTQRIIEDKLRLMRAIRFAARLDFEIEENSFRAVKENSHLISKVSSERIGEELIKILSVTNKRRAIELLFDLGIIHHIIPEFVAMKGCEQPVDYHPEGDCFSHTIMSMSKLPEDASSELLMATFLHDIGKPVTQTFEERIRFDCHDVEGAKIAEAILNRLKFSNEFIEHTVSMVRNHMKFMHVKDMRISRLKRFMNLPKFNEHLELHRADCMSSHEGLDNYHFIVEKLKSFESEPEKNIISKLPRLITGHDLISMGFVQGPIFRTILTEIEDLQLEGKISTREEAIEQANKYLNEHVSTYQNVNKYSGEIWFASEIVRKTIIKRAIFRNNFEELVIDFDYVDDVQYHYTVKLMLSGPDVYSGTYIRDNKYENNVSCTIIRDKNKIFGDKGSWFEDGEHFEWGCELFEVEKFSDEKR